jgi:ATP phosphoribosyltransferase regulatory subunit
MTDAKSNRWLLPDGIVEVLPEEAARLERLRRRLLDMYRTWGYGLVMPPFIEYLESLLTGTGHDLDLQTFKLTDQLTGRLMGLRADMTPQVARIDAHTMRRSGPNRLCYIGTVLHTRPDGFAGSRSPLQVGAELFGHAGIESDIEVISLMLETLALAGISPVYVDLGHVGIYRALAARAGLNAADEALLFELLQRKAVPEIEDFVQARDLARVEAAMLTRLAALSGGDEVLEQARRALEAAGSEVSDAIDHLASIARQVQARYPETTVHFDLSELRGFHYHTGVVFAAYLPGQGQEIARGGRYDEVGKVFGRARPATGFTTDLRTLAVLGAMDVEPARPAILAPSGDLPDLRDAVDRLRASGEIVIQTLPGDASEAAELGCDRVMVNENNKWVVREL